jgi:DNA-binding LacI/PurR family transcriptional regulator
LPIETRHKVQALAHELNYTPRRYKRKENIDKTPKNANELILALAYRTEEDNTETSIFLEIMQGISQAALDHNVSILIKTISSLDDACDICNENNGRVKGVITIFNAPFEVMEYISGKYKCISINHSYPHLPVRVIDSDQAGGIFKLYEHLYEMGHRHIGFCSVQNSSALAYPRFAGYQAGLRSFDTTLDPEAVFNIFDHKATAFNEQIDKIIDLHQNHGYTAFISTSGSFCKKIYEALLKREIKVPEQISLATYDEITKAIAPGVMLTGVESPYETMAGLALESLCHTGNNQSLHDCTISCKPIFMPGNTVAPLRSI